MYSHLSKKDKQKKLAQVQKRAIIWSIKQKTISAFRNTTSINSKQTQSTTTYKIRQKREIPLKTHETSGTAFCTPISLPEQIINTIQAIQQTL